MNKMLKQTITLALTILLLFVSVGTSEVLAMQPISGAALNDQLLFNMDGQTVTPVGDDGSPVLPISYNGTTYLPVRALGYLLGLGIDYEATTKTVLISSTTDKSQPVPTPVAKTGKLIPISGAVLNSQMSFKIDQREVVPVGEGGSPVLPISYNGTTYLPVRALGDLLGIGVDFEAHTKTVLLKKAGNKTGNKQENKTENVYIDSQDNKTVYIDGQGNEVYVTSGAKAFADRVVQYVPGDPAPTERYQDATQALGEPDFVPSYPDDGFVSLGGSGQITVEFTQVYLVDGPGADLHVFEIGPAVESMELEISKDNKNWINIGKISGGTAAVDISPFVSPGDQFSYVRLTDLRDNPSGDTAGADLDAVAAINNISKSSSGSVVPSPSEPTVPAVPSSPPVAEEPQTYTDGQGNQVSVSFGAKAFADRVVKYVPGEPAPTERYQDAAQALGEPDFVPSYPDDGFVSLGGSGQLTVEFTQVYLVDGPGADLHVFEIGPAVESMELEISKDNKNWIKIGKISGGTAAVDISPFVSPGDQFSYVRLTDLRDNPSGDTAGADVDAIAAVNAIGK